jgi:hypothetical protein
MLKTLIRISKVITIASLFIGLSFSPIIGGTYQYSQVSDKLDQQQIKAISPHFLSWSNKLAQSFKPEFDCLTRIQLSISKVQNPSDIIISIRKELDGNDLTSIKKLSEYFLIYPDKALFEFNLPNITVVPEQTYYIIFQHESEHTRDDILCWWYNPNGTYTRGTAWRWTVENGSKWTELDYDFCFKIFGYNSQNNQTNNSTDVPPDTSKETPGFELFFVICTIALILLCKRKKKL